MTRSNEPEFSRGYRALTAAVVAGTVLLIAVGALVRSTGSGLGCPDWPLCHGELLPLRDRAAMIEWSHRAVASVVGLLILVEVVWTVRLAPRSRSALVGVVLLGVLAVQALLGREAVRRELPPEVVAIHLMTALALLAGLVWLAARAWWPALTSGAGLRTPGRTLSLIVLGGMAVTMGVGAYMVASGGSLGCTGWPGCPQAPVPLVDGSRAQDLHWLHRLVVVGVFGLVGYQALAARDTKSLPLVQRATTLLVALYLAQALVGAANVWLSLDTSVRVTHLFLGSVVWVLAVGLAAVAWVDESSRRAAPAGRGGV